MSRNYLIYALVVSAVLTTLLVILGSHDVGMTINGREFPDWLAETIAVMPWLFGAFVLFEIVWKSIAWGWRQLFWGKS